MLSSTYATVTFQTAMPRSFWPRVLSVVRRATEGGFKVRSRFVTSSGGGPATTPRTFQTSYPVKSGSSYKILADGSPATNGPFQISITLPAAPVNAASASRPPERGNRKFLRQQPRRDQANRNGPAALETADPDSDGVPNLLELAFGSNPKASDPSHSQVRIFPVDGGWQAEASLDRNAHEALFGAPRWKFPSKSPATSPIGSPAQARL